MKNKKGVGIVEVMLLVCIILVAAYLVEGAYSCNKIGGKYVRGLVTMECIQ